MGIANAINTKTTRSDMIKTDLEVFVEMNKNDTENDTKTLELCPDWRNANKTKGGAVIEMGMPEERLYKIMSGETIPILILVDKKAFFDIKNNPQGGGEK